MVTFKKRIDKPIIKVKINSSGISKCKMKLQISDLEKEGTKEK